MKLYQYYEDFGRMGSLEGMFFLTEEQYKYVIGKTIYDSDILGKHSEVELTFDINTVEEVKLSETTIAEMFSVLGSSVSGISPLDYVDQWEEESEADEWDDDDE